jgi:hypothetical protein
MSAAMVTPSSMVVVVLVHVVVVGLLLNIDYLRLWWGIVDWGRGAIGVLVGKWLILISVLRLISVHFINYNY